MVLKHHWLGYLAILMQTLVCCLLVYGLIIGSGNIIVSGCQKIGFYNYCLYNESTKECQCITQMKDLSFAGRTGPHGFILARIFTYSSVVSSMMGILAMTFAQCSDKRSLWTFSLGLNGVGLMGLSFGMITFLIVTWDLFDFSQVTPCFLAILAALVGMSVLCGIIKHRANLANEVLEVKTNSDLTLL